MDVMIQKTQEWLNGTYGSDSRFNVINPVDGLTGWTTINALIRALQIELGITATADNFGTTSKTKFTQKYPNGVQQQADGAQTEDNVYAIIQGALWCKGYSTGASEITKHFYGGTGNAVKSLKSDAGLLTPSSTVTLNVMTALLSMNQYVRVSGGSSEIRSIQQSLNRKYESYIGLAPCDGLYGRDMNKALIIVLQAVEGLSVSSATGSFGPTTKSLCPILPDTGNLLNAQKEADAINLLRYALCCNGYSISVLSSAWENDLLYAIGAFQTDMALPVNGVADLNTWMSLLLSSGNPDRSALACDTRFEITTDRIAQLKNNGYQIVGRYLTGTDFKVLRPDEPQRILDNEMYFFPIFQESDSSISYFTSARGATDAENAVRAVRNFGIPEETVIFFAVDLDAQSSEITNYILPYFNSLKANIDTAYKVGVYGTRNVCTQVYNEGYAVTSFVSDMSTGYSGNMGFKMPLNWTYDQFFETPMSPDWGIDKDAFSGKFFPVTSLTEVYLNHKPAPAPNGGLIGILSFIDSVRALEQHYVDYYANDEIPLTPELITLGVTNFLRSVKYDEIEWDITTTRPIDHQFVQYVQTDDNIFYNDKTLYDFIIPYITGDTNNISDGQNGLLDLAHLIATTECYISSTTPHFWAGWGGDLATAMADTTAAHNNDLNKSIQLIADEFVGLETKSFKYSDMCQDADAIKIASLINASSSTINRLSDSLNTYYTSYVQNRYSNFVDDIDCLPNLTALKEKIFNLMNGAVEHTPVYGLLALAGYPSEEVKVACCNSFANYIYSELI